MSRGVWRRFWKLNLSFLERRALRSESKILYINMLQHVPWPQNLPAELKLLTVEPVQSECPLLTQGELNIAAEITPVQTVEDSLYVKKRRKGGVWR
jgi:hypothetical protein